MMSMNDTQHVCVEYILSGDHQSRHSSTYILMQHICPQDRPGAHISIKRKDTYDELLFLTLVEDTVSCRQAIALVAYIWSLDVCIKKRWPVRGVVCFPPLLHDYDL